MSEQTFQGVDRRAHATRAAHLTRRRFGYILWLVALGFVFVPEILASSASVERHLPFTTLSGMVGHLEYLQPAVEIPVTALIVFALASILRVPPRERSGGWSEERAGTEPHRTAGGRITFKVTDHARRPASAFDDDDTPIWFGLASLAAGLAIAGATIAARVWWPDPAPHGNETNALFHPAYVLYGSIGLLWFVVPSIYAFVGGKDAPFPTLFRTYSNALDWLRGRGERGRASAWVVSLVVIWGLAFLLIHLTLYPFPNIARLLNPTGQ